VATKPLKNSNPPPPPKPLAETYLGENPPPFPPENEVTEAGTIGSTNSSAASDTAPLHEIPVEALEEAPAPGTAPAEIIPPVKLMDKEKFFSVFGGLFVLTGNMYGMLPPLHRPLLTLTRAPQLPTARPASDAIYELAEKHDWLHWLIEEDSQDLHRFLAIGAFGAQIAIGVRDEMSQHRQLIFAMQQRAEAEERTAQPEAERPPAQAQQGPQFQ
jgi:hypothetical protein